MKFIFNQIAELADQELDDESMLREDLLLLQVQYDEGDIDDDEYVEREAALMVGLLGVLSLVPWPARNDGARALAAARRHRATAKPKS